MFCLKTQHAVLKSSQYVYNSLRSDKTHGVFESSQYTILLRRCTPLRSTSDSDGWTPDWLLIYRLKTFP